MTILIDHNIDLIDLDAALPHLSEQRRRHVLAITNQVQRRQSVAAYLLLCRALAEATGSEPSPAPTFAFGPHGKPELVGMPGVHFSMSHCRGAVAVAVAGEPVGIDIERIGRYSESLVRHTMNEAEQRDIFSSPQPQRRFIDLWTRKESLLKMTGQGLQGGLRDALAQHPGARFTQQQGDDFVCTVCLAAR